MPRLRWTFLVAIVLGAALVFATAAFGGSGETPHVDARQVVKGVWISGQVAPEQLAQLKAQGFRAVVDLRPDNEGPGQPSAGTMGAAAAQQGMAFDYAPVSPGAVPAAAVDTLGRALARGEQPVLLYCRNGSRAARTWALAEASRPGGLDADAIVDAVRQAGQNAGDLRDQIVARIAARPSAR